MADYSTDFEDLTVGEDFAAPVDGWESNEGIQEVVSSPARGTRAVRFGNVDVGGSNFSGNIIRSVTLTNGGGVDITYWAYRRTPVATTVSGPSCTFYDPSSPFWAFQVGFTLDGGWNVYIASEDNNSPSEIRAQALFEPPEEEWFKMRVRAQPPAIDGDDGTVIVSINDVVLLDYDDIPMPASIEGLYFHGFAALLDDIELVDGFNDDPETLTAIAINLGSTGSLVVKAHRAIATCVDGGDHTHDEPNTWIHYGAFKVEGDVDLPGLSIPSVAVPRAIYPLGGSRNQALQHNAVMDAYDYLDTEIDSAEVAGMTVQARVEVRVGNSGISVTPEIYNVTDASVEVTGSACSATNADYSGTNQKQTLTITPATGAKQYRLRLTPSANTFPVWGIGTVEVIP